jgi:hypothetical protein
MRVLPGEIREGVVDLTKEAVNEIDKYPVVAMYVRAQLAFQNPVLGKVIDRIVSRSCSAPATLAALATSSHSPLTRAPLQRNYLLALSCIREPDLGKPPEGKPSTG